MSGAAQNPDIPIYIARKETGHVVGLLPCDMIHVSSQNSSSKRFPSTLQMAMHSLMVGL